jgi:hypothetical protein
VPLSGASDSDGRAAAERSMDVALDAAVHTSGSESGHGRRSDYVGSASGVPDIADHLLHSLKSAALGQELTVKSKEVGSYSGNPARRNAAE